MHHLLRRKESANSTGYDVVLGKGSKKEHGETRPYQYGKYKKLNVKPGVCKAVFKNIPAGTYYAGVHSWNRTASENDNKVFSKWSNLEPFPRTTSYPVELADSLYVTVIVEPFVLTLRISGLSGVIAVTENA